MVANPGKKSKYCAKISQIFIPKPQIDPRLDVYEFFWYSHLSVTTTEDIRVPYQKDHRSSPVLGLGRQHRMGVPHVGRVLRAPRWDLRHRRAVQLPIQAEGGRQVNGIAEDLLESSVGLCPFFIVDGINWLERRARARTRRRENREIRRCKQMQHIWGLW